MKIEFCINQHGRRYCSMMDAIHCSPECQEKHWQAQRWGLRLTGYAWVCFAHDSRILQQDEAGLIAFDECQKKAAAIIKKLEKEKEKDAAEKEQRRLF